HFTSILQFNGVLDSYNQSGLRYASKYYPDDGHGSVPLIAGYDALRFIFAAYRAELFKALDRAEFVKEHFAGVSASLGITMLPPERMVDMLGHIDLSRDTAKAIAL